jgi:hypothetical protein
VQHLAHQLTGVDAVDVFGDGSQGAGETEPSGDDVGDLDRRGRHQPHPLAAVEVLLGDRSRAGPDALGHVLVEDLLADLLQLTDRVPLDEGQRGRPGLGDVLGVLDTGDAEVHLLPDRAEDVAGREELAAMQPAREVEDRRALHDRVVDVEERRRRDVGLGGEGVLDLGGRRSGLAGQHRSRLQIALAITGGRAGHGSDSNRLGSVGACG